MKRAVFGLTFGILASLTGCVRDATEIVLVVTSELAVPDQIDHLTIIAQGTELEGGFEQTYDITREPNWLPLSLELVSAGGARPLRVVVTGFQGGKPMVTATESTSFVAGETRFVRVELQRAAPPAVKRH